MVLERAPSVRLCPGEKNLSEGKKTIRSCQKTCLAVDLDKNNVQRDLKVLDHRRSLFFSFFIPSFTFLEHPSLRFCFPL